MGFLIKVIVIFIVFNFIFRLIGKVFLPMFITNRVNKMTGNQSQQDFRRESKRNEGQVTIKKTQEHKKMTPDDMGEYVNFEEVK
ncbi:DUF4834 family protein [Saccharicrinis aurantiacus]|uniref:DUF4834 family protein n=1 Tax=Saccharicrinis aurantiacus TaxID=1849719 RepID=UPI00094FB950|nr:DUF4834 family protein [Saccharicrinis aurantiacus]